MNDFSQKKNRLDNYFGLSKNNTNVKTEVVAGITTFMTMAYILIVNPSILSSTGMDSGAVFTATALSAVVATLIMGLYAKLPFAQVVDYFSYPCLWVLGYILLLGENKRQKAFPVIIYLMNLLSVFLRGVEFGGFLQCTLYFLAPLLLSMAKRRKLIKLRYVAVAAILLVMMLVPKYNHFSEAIAKGYADTSYGLTTAYDFLMYRMLAQEADLTWEIDRQVWMDGEIDPERVFDVAKEVIGIPTEENSTQYLMNRGCSSSALTIYSYSTAAVTGGYPILWVAILGYIFAIPFLIVDSYLLFLVIRCVCEGMEKQRLFLILAGGYLLCQCYTIVISANFSAIGNTIPHIFIVLLLILYKRIGMIRIGNHTFWI